MMVFDSLDLAVTLVKNDLIEKKVCTSSQRAASEHDYCKPNNTKLCTITSASSLKFLTLTFFYILSLIACNNFGWTQNICSIEGKLMSADRTSTPV